MNTLARKSIKLIKQKGPVAFIKSAWRWGWKEVIRPILPFKRNYLYNGIKVPIQYHPLDRYLPGIKPSEPRPNFESGLISALKKIVLEGDTVVTLGGGWGVTAVRAAELVGDSGQVLVYEGAEGSINKVQQTTQINGLGDRIEIFHAIVGPKVDLMHGGDSTDAESIDPSELPECDILEMDIEGSEIDVIKGLNNRPKWILVETHGWKGTPSSEVQAALESKGYNLINKELADRDRVDMCENNDIYVLTARLD